MHSDSVTAPRSRIDSPISPNPRPPGPLARHSSALSSFFFSKLSISIKSSPAHSIPTPLNTISTHDHKSPWHLLARPQPPCCVRCGGQARHPNKPPARLRRHSPSGRVPGLHPPPLLPLRRSNSAGQAQPRARARARRLRRTPPSPPRKSSTSTSSPPTGGTPTAPRASCT